MSALYLNVTRHRPTHLGILTANKLYGLVLLTQAYFFLSDWLDWFELDKYQGVRVLFTSLLTAGFAAGPPGRLTLMVRVRSQRSVMLGDDVACSGTVLAVPCR